MLISNKKILILTGVLNRTGAPISLYNYFKWFKKKHPGLSIDVISLKGGHLEKSFRDIADSVIVVERDFLPPKWIRFLNMFTTKFGLDLLKRSIDKNMSKFSSGSYDILYANTIIPFDYALKLSKNNGSKLVLHLHEMNYTIRLHDSKIYEQAHLCDAIIGASELVLKELKENAKGNLDEHRLFLLYESSESARIYNNDKVEFVVGASGYYQWRKGPDFFIQIAKSISKRKISRKVKFIWLGKTDAKDRLAIDLELLKYGLTECVEFLDEVEDPGPIFSSFDVFIHPSREDPFPLVCIEAGQQSKPILIWEGCTGIEEVLPNKEFCCIEYGNITEMVNKITMYIEDEDIIRKHGEDNRLVFENFTPNNRGPFFEKIMIRILS